MFRVKLFIKSPAFKHLLGWLLFSLLFIYKTEAFNSRDVLYSFYILISSAAAVYINLYYLSDRFYFTKKYFKYIISLLVLTFSYALFLYIVIPQSGTRYVMSFGQNISNIIFLILLSSSFKFYEEMKKRQFNLNDLETEQLKTELSLLKSQVNPHFLFNTLNNLFGLIVNYQNEEAAILTLKLSDLMRYLLESSKTEKVSLRKEIKFLEDYLELEKIRLPQQVDIRLEVSGLEKEVFVAPLLFIPLVENAFKHGLQTISQNSFAYFSLAIQGNELFFETQNSTGKTFENQTRSGMGLQNLRQRLALSYPKKHFLEIEETQNVFKVSLQILL